MTDPMRLVDESADELERALLRAGRNYRASPAARERTLAALGIAGAATLLGKLAGAVATSWSVKTGLVAAGVAAAVGASIYAVESGDEPESAPSSTSAPRAPEPVAPPVEATPGLRSASGPTEPAPPSGAREPASVAPVPQGPASIQAELRAVDAARSALAAGNGAEALRRLDIHARSFPRGRLKLEAEVLRIEAMARTGDSAGASARARAFLARHPNSVFAPRVERFAGK